MRQTTLVGAILALTMVLVVAVPALAGAPFGGDDTGCVPADKVANVCSQRMAQALSKLDAKVIKCHLVQAGQAFKTGHSAPGFDNAEENCEQGPSNTSARAKFEAVLTKYATTCDPTLIANTRARGEVILADQSNPESLDALNGSFFCDDGSGLTIAEPGGDDAGFIPPAVDDYKCSVAVAKAYSKLLVTVYKCHYKAAKAALLAKPFDEEACEDNNPLSPLKSALARYNAQVQKYIGLGGCPSCLADPSNAPAALALGANAVATLDAQNAEIFPCP